MLEDSPVRPGGGAEADKPGDGMARVFWDTNLFIYLLEEHPVFADQVTELRRRMVERVRRGHAMRVQKVLGALNIAEQRELHRLLDRLGDHLEHLTSQDNGADYD